MSRRADFDGVAQGDTLTRCRLLSGKSRTQVAVQIGIEADTYRKYETGQTELRVSQVKPFAEALGITAPELSSALGICEQANLRVALGAMFDRPEIVDSAVAALTRLSSTDSVDALRIFRDLRAMNLTS